jgi:hypothetical protein
MSLAADYQLKESSSQHDGEKVSSENPKKTRFVDSAINNKVVGINCNMEI